MSVSVLAISLDSQIARAGEGVSRGDPVERQRRYAAQLDALHVIIKTAARNDISPRLGRAADGGRITLAPNAWAYPTRSR